MQYRLRTLVLITAIGPPLLAGTYWAVRLLGNPVALGLTTAVAMLAALVFGLIAWYHELVRMIAGPSAAKSWRRKQRRKVRVRIERYVAGST